MRALQVLFRIVCHMIRYIIDILFICCAFQSTDIDECTEKSTRLQCKEIGAECFNLPGSYECRCDRGYQHGDEHCEGNISVSRPLLIPAEWEGQDSLFASRKLTVKNFKVRLASNILICWNELFHFEINHPFNSGCDRERDESVLRWCHNCFAIQNSFHNQWRI